MTLGELKSAFKDFSRDLLTADYSEIIPYIGDINIVIDNSGYILQINVPKESPVANLKNWTSKNINDYLTIESKEKLDSQITSLSDISQTVTKWFELNHTSLETGEFPVRYKGFNIPKTKHILLVGNDLSHVAEIQKKFVNSQLALEREYTKYRSFETKYKALVEFTTDPIVLVNGLNGSIVDINQYGYSIFNLKRDKLLGQNIEKFFDWTDNKSLLEVLKSDAVTNSQRTLSLNSSKKSTTVIIKSAIFRAENDLCLMLKFIPVNKNTTPREEFPTVLRKFFENTRDGIVFTDKSGIIKHVNNSFLSLCNTGSDQLILERSFSDFLARGIVDLKVLIEAALDNGTTMPFTTQLISAYEIKIDIEITGTKASNEYGTFICFLISYKPNAITQNTNDVVVSEQATQKIMKLVGSAPLKELVADTNDIVEKICIETALKMTKNNRVATAEMLNLSRQSLYVKLRKYNLL